MSHFAKVVDGIVTQVIVAGNGGSGIVIIRYDVDQ